MFLISLQQCVKTKMKAPDKKIIEIADYIFENPTKSKKDVMALFGDKWRGSPTSPRTFDRLIQKAKEYNKERLQTQEKVRDEVLIKQTKDAVKTVILSRDNALEILSSIATGKAKKLPTKSEIIDGKEVTTNFDIVRPSERDRIAAIGKLAEMQGWDAPKKTEFSNTTPTYNISVSGEKTQKTLENFFEK